MTRSLREVERACDRVADKWRISFLGLHNINWVKPGLHCDVSINKSITNVHTCCISTRQAQWAPEWSPGSMGRGTFSKRRKTTSSCFFCWSADARYFFTHNFLIIAAFICAWDLWMLLTQKAFFLFERPWVGAKRPGAKWTWGETTRFPFNVVPKLFDRVVVLKERYF